MCLSLIQTSFAQLYTLKTLTFVSYEVVEVLNSFAHTLNGLILIL